MNPQQPMSPEQLAQLAQQWVGSSGYDANKARENAKPQNQYWSPKNGTVVFRLLPPGPPGNAVLAQGLWARKYFKHWIEIPSLKATAGKDKKDSQFTLYDPARSYPGKFTENPVGDALGELEPLVPSDVLGGFRSKARCLANLFITEIFDERQNPIDRDFCNKVIIADLPIGFFDHLRKEVASPFGEYFNPFLGLPMTLTKTGQGKMNTEYAYGVLPGSARCPILPDLRQLEKMLSEVPDLDNIVANNCQRDIEVGRTVAAKLREWGNAIQQSRFGGGGAPPAMSGYTPGALPGSPPWQPAAPQQPTSPPWQQVPPQAPPAQWGPAQPPSAPVWPGQPPSAPVQPVMPPQQAYMPPPPSQQQAPQPPAQPAPTPAVQPAALTRPACYGQFYKLNGTDPAAADNPTNVPCKTCPWKAVCMFESPAA